MRTPPPCSMVSPPTVNLPCQQEPPSPLPSPDPPPLPNLPPSPTPDLSPTLTQTQHNTQPRTPLIIPPCIPQKTRPRTPHNTPPRAPHNTPPCAPPGPGTIRGCTQPRSGANRATNEYASMTFWNTMDSSQDLFHPRDSPTDTPIMKNHWHAPLPRKRTGWEGEWSNSDAGMDVESVASDDSNSSSNPLQFRGWYKPPRNAKMGVDGSVNGAEARRPAPRSHIYYCQRFFICLLKVCCCCVRKKPPRRIYQDPSWEES